MNQQVVSEGMFLVCADLRDASSKLRGHSCRSAMLRYKSPLLQQISTWLLSPLLILGLREEYQNIPVELFSNYNEEQLHPVTDVYIEVQSKTIQFYSVSLHIIADFTGLRYVMFHWPTVSAIIGKFSFKTFPVSPINDFTPSLCLHQQVSVRTSSSFWWSFY